MSGEPYDDRFATENVTPAGNTRGVLEMIRDDAKADASKDVPFSARGLGEDRGETLAMIHHLARQGLYLLDRIEELELRDHHRTGSIQ